MVNRQEFGRRIFFEDSQPLLNIPKRDARDSLIQTASLLTLSRNMRIYNVGWNAKYQHGIFSGFTQLLQRTVGICT